MRTKIICLCFALLIVTASPSCTANMDTILQHGSFVPFIFQKNEKLIIAADSRAISLNGKQRAENDCKIVKLGEHSVFASSGYTSAFGRYGILEFSNDFSREAYQKYPNDPERMMNFWMYKMSQALSIVASQASLASTPKGLVVMAIFGSESHSKIEVWHGEIRYEIGKLKALSEALNPQHSGFFTEGFDEQVSEFEASTTDRSIRLHEQARRDAMSSGSFADYDAYELRALVEAIEAWSNDDNVGGPVDIIVLRAGQAAKWVKHKRNCRQSAPGAFLHLQQEIDRLSQ
jgi:hypothetical protein